MYVHLKQSGELLASQGAVGDIWTPTGIVASAEKTRSVFHSREKLSIDGLLIVSGAGNIIRGEKLRSEGIADGMADLLGRLATIQNTIVLSKALSERNVPNKVFIADTMRISDASIPTDFLEPYSTDAAIDAYAKERVVLVAGGTGEDNKTTDNAVLEYARRHQIQNESDEILVLKGTKHDGVYDADPAKNARAQRYSKISAGHMLGDYEKFAVVDRPCLETIQQSGLSLRIYADGKHDMQSVLSGNEVGTVIVPGHDKPQY